MQRAVGDSSYPILHLAAVGRIARCVIIPLFGAWNPSRVVVERWHLAQQARPRMDRPAQVHVSIPCSCLLLLSHRYPTTSLRADNWHCSCSSSPARGWMRSPTLMVEIMSAMDFRFKALSCHRESCLLVCSVCLFAWPSEKGGQLMSTQEAPAQVTPSDSLAARHSGSRHR